MTRHTCCAACSDSSLDATTEALPGISITGASSAEVIRLRCRTTLLLQHLVDRTHQRCAAHMSAAVQLELLDVLQVRHSSSKQNSHWERPVLRGCTEWMSDAVSCVACALPCQLAGRLPHAELAA